MLGNRSRRIAAAAGLATGLALSAGATSAVASTTRTAEHFSDATSEAATNPCTGAPGTLETTADITRWMTESDTGRVRYWISIRGEASFVPDDPAAVTYRGPFTLKYAETDDEAASAGRAWQTTKVTLDGTDGTSITEQERSRTRSDGVTTVEVDRSTVRCP